MAAIIKFARQQFFDICRVSSKHFTSPNFIMKTRLCEEWCIIEAWHQAETLKIATDRGVSVPCSSGWAGKRGCACRRDWGCALSRWHGPSEPTSGWEQWNVAFHSIDEWWSHRCGTAWTAPLNEQTVEYKLERGRESSPEPVQLFLFVPVKPIFS